MSRSRLLLHEWLCLGFFVWMLVQLVLSAGFSNRDTLIFSSLLAANCALVYFLPHGGNSDLGWRLRLLFYPVAMNLLYFVLGTAIPAIHPGREDAALQAVDRALIGTNLSIRMEPLVHPVFTDIFSFCYILYFLYLILGQFSYLFGDLPVLKKYFAGLFSLYALGYFGYSLVPALGPYLAMGDQFGVPLTEAGLPQ